jgi:hypothetical protein
MAIGIKTPSLETGDNLSRGDFLASWEQLPDVRFAELINGIVYLRPDSAGIFRSRVFPGLCLSSKAFFKNDMAKVLATLQEGLASTEHQRFVAELAERKRNRG